MEPINARLCMVQTSLVADARAECVLFFLPLSWLCPRLPPLFANAIRSPPKEEDDMRAAEVLQGLKGVGGS